jgi:hypothetical protein
LFVHTTGKNSTFVGAGTGNAFISGFGGNSGFGAGALKSNTTGGANTAVGYNGLRYNTTAAYNSAFGNSALQSNTMGSRNSAVGLYALRYNTAGYDNTAVGVSALNSSNGSQNSALGISAFWGNTTGFGNSAVGASALAGNTTGSLNVAVGRIAGQIQTTGSNNIYLASSGVAAESGRIRIGTSGTHNLTFIAGIRGVTTVNANAIPVLIDSTGQLGTTSSSRSVNKEIRDMGDATDRLLDLRPVTLRYKQDQTLPSGGKVPPEYGLIAEEVAKVFPDLVVYDERGQPFTVKYHEIAPMLLNEMKKLRSKIEKQRQENQEQLAEIEAQRRENQAQQAEIAVLTTRLARVETRVSGATGKGAAMKKREQEAADARVFEGAGRSRFRERGGALERPTPGQRGNRARRVARAQRRRVALAASCRRLRVDPTRRAPVPPLPVRKPE